MQHQPAKPISTVRLEFRQGSTAAQNLSAVERVGPCLFVASDEGAGIERLVTQDGALYGGHHGFSLADAFDLPAGAEGEVDVEGMMEDDGWLWVVGSHSLARRKPKPEHDEKEALERLTEVRRDANRYLLGRIPLVEGQDGLPALAAEDGERRAGCLKFKDSGNALTKALRRDEHLGRFLDVPAKENGFDIEGIAVRGGRVFLGLRGPVLRGWACILELEVEAGKKGQLKLRRIGPDGERFRKHFIDLDGLGIRELTFDGADLVILAGPTMDLDGPVTVWRWADALDVKHERVIPRDRLSRVIDLPFGHGTDHAEGITRVERAGAAPLLMVVYDSPAPERVNGAVVLADLFVLPSRYDPANATLA
ncbi:DUF3616 domain-containing protein [Azospirillum sp. SYSU D00513]|uniref:DUF3616 domain-containing protein n=1 Tax=Azospirillum sp. SYSU D00513 TaxID=2812561 RepID=UPI001A969E26|nr:DUF3616 domain-containing protein [Azospirillum sp. SYSU D00513]